MQPRRPARATRPAQLKIMDPNCFERIGFFLQAHDLKKKSLLHNTDAYAVVYVKNTPTSQLLQIGITECVLDTSNPAWTTSIEMEYHFEMSQEVVVKIYDKNEGCTRPLDQLQHHTYYGEISFKVPQLMTSRNHFVDLPLRNGPSSGTVIVRAEAQCNTRDILIATFVGEGLVKKNGIIFGHSDPFLKFSRLSEDGSWTLVHKSVELKNNANPSWQALHIPIQSLCNGDLYRNIKIEIMDWESSGNHNPMGEVETSVHAMLAGSLALAVAEKDKVGRKGYTNSGTLRIQGAVVENHPTLADFIMNGCEVSLAVAIDFTGSNGDPTDPTSLHYIHPNGVLNQYQQAIASVGRICEVYDTDKRFPVIGFGGKIRRPDGQWSAVQHCFPVYGGGMEVQGVDGILHAYHDCLSNVLLSGPTLFAPLLDSIGNVARQSGCCQERQKYTVLLIITDGEINDMPATVAALVQASHEPLSVIIVGVGQADFSSMKILDGDGKKLSAGGQPAVRDIVQFVAFEEYLLTKGIASLAQDVLAEIPSQLLSYMSSKRIVPNAAAR